MSTKQSQQPSYLTTPSPHAAQQPPKQKKTKRGGRRGKTQAALQKQTEQIALQQHIEEMELSLERQLALGPRTSGGSYTWELSLERQLALGPRTSAPEQHPLELPDEPPGVDRGDCDGSSRLWLYLSPCT